MTWLATLLVTLATVLTLGTLIASHIMHSMLRNATLRDEPNTHQKGTS